MTIIDELSVLNAWVSALELLFVGHCVSSLNPEDVAAAGCRILDAMRNSLDGIEIEARRNKS